MTLDTKAPEAALAALKQFPVLDGRITAFHVAHAIEAYNATRSQSLPDELKAIAERAKELDDMEGPIPPDMLQAYFNWAHEDRDFLLSFIPDVVRACAQLAEDEKDNDENGKRDFFSSAGPIGYRAACNEIKKKILSILDHPIKSESQIREEERERCAKELELKARQFSDEVTRLLDLKPVQDSDTTKGLINMALAGEFKSAATAIRNGKTEG